MITEVWLDETVDEEVFTLDIRDGPLWFVVEGDFELATENWFVSWATVDGTSWFDALFLPNDGLPDEPANLGLIDPRLTDDLLRAPVTQWKWS